MDHPEPHLFTRFLARLPPVLLVVAFVIMFVVAITFVQKLDNIGSGWDSKKPNMTLHENPTPDWCTPTKPFFYYDLGGTLCACKKGWDKQEYWAKTFTSFSFGFPHVFTPLQIYIVYQRSFVYSNFITEKNRRWTWVLIYILFNEAFEETMLALTGYWGFTYDPPSDLEPRYDSFIRDVMICGLPGMLLGIQFVRVFRVPPYLKFPLAKSWDAVGLHSKRHHAKVFFQMLVLKQIPLVYNTDYGKGRFYSQNLVLCFLYMMVHTVNYFWNRYDWPSYMSVISRFFSHRDPNTGIRLFTIWPTSSAISLCSLALCQTQFHPQRRVLVFHVAWAVTSVYMVLYTIYPLLEELYLVCIAMASTSLAFTVISLTRNYNCVKATAAEDEMEMAQIESKGLLTVNSGGGGNEEEERRNMMVHAEDVLQIALDLQQEGPTLTLDRLLSEVSRASNERAAEEKKDSGIGHVCGMVFGVAWIVVMAVVIFYCVREPLIWDGIMYRRHWCGLVIDEGGNGCIEVGGGLKG